MLFTLENYTFFYRYFYRQCSKFRSITDFYIVTSEVINRQLPYRKVLINFIVCFSNKRSISFHINTALYTLYTDICSIVCNSNFFYTRSVVRGLKRWVNIIRDVGKNGFSYSQIFLSLTSKNKILKFQKKKIIEQFWHRIMHTHVVYSQNYTLHLASFLGHPSKLR